VDLMGMFISMFLLFFSLALLAFGALTAYFGTGRSRSIGGALILFGLAALFAVIWLGGVLPGMSSPLEMWDTETLQYGFTATMGAVAGAAVSLGIFLAAIIKA